MSGGRVILGARNVSKAFFGSRALRDVSIDLVPGRIHALLGENGAGKSTLINVLSGAVAPDSGQVLVDGRAVAALAPREAHRLGVAVVQQELKSGSSSLNRGEHRAWRISAAMGTAGL